MTSQMEKLPVDLRQKRGHCADCGYYGWLQGDTGVMILHAVRRVRLGLNGEAETYESLALGDDVCSGSNKAPEQLLRARGPKRMT